MLDQLTFPPGAVVEVKRVGLGGRWERAVVDEDDGRRVRVQMQGGSELLVPKSRVRVASTATSARSFGGAQLAAARRMSAERQPSAPPEAGAADAPLTPPERRRVAAAALRAVPKPAKPAKDKDHLQRVREMPCCWCSAPPPSDPHHFGPHGMGTKASDLRTVPLCRRCHDRFHDGTLGERPAVEIHFRRVQVELLEERLLEAEGG